MMNITLELTKAQSNMLTVMWKLDTPSDYANWYRTLSHTDRIVADTLKEVLIMEYAELKLMGTYTKEVDELMARVAQKH